MTPQKYPQNLHTPQKFSFLKTRKNVEIQNFEPPKIARVYIPCGTDGPKMKNLPSSQI